MILHADRVSKHFNGVTALANFSLTVGQGEIVGLIGPNGAGKTTFFNVISGLIRADSGKVRLCGRDVTGWPLHRVADAGVARTFQTVRLIRGMSVLENVMVCFRGQHGERLTNVWFRRSCVRAEERRMRANARSLIRDAGLDEMANVLARDLSYGQQKLLSLVCCLAADAKLLLLDEPVGAISPHWKHEILALLRACRASGRSIVLVEHDLDAIAKVCDRAVFMDAGQKLCEGTLDEIRQDPSAINAYLE